MNGTLGILNVGAGDTKLTFDKDKPEERRRAAAVVTDMLQRGFAILVQVGERDGKPLYQRAEAFDPETCEYIIVGTPEPPPASGAGEDAGALPPPKRTRAPRIRVPAADTHGVAVSRSAGG